jgi:hypothetical protein
MCCNSLIIWWIACAGAGFGSEALQQLVLIVADGRFHEKAALQRAVREARAMTPTPPARAALCVCGIRVIGACKAAWLQHVVRLRTLLTDHHAQGLIRDP